MKDILPIVVPLSYFDLPPDAGVAPGLDAFGIVKLLGNDVASLLTRDEGKLRKNVHLTDLAKGGIDRAGAETLALKNLDALVTGGKCFQQTVTQLPSGTKFAIWMGDRYTSSCLLWPGLYAWAQKELEADQVIVCVPQVQWMFVAEKGDAESRATLNFLVGNLIKDMDKRISNEWFELTSTGIAPFQE